MVHRPVAPNDRTRRGMTLIELTVAIAVMSLVAVVLGGLTSAVGMTRRHVVGIQEATTQGSFAVDRIRDAIARAAYYRIGTNATVAGVAVVRTNATPMNRPDTLVVWTGSRSGSTLAAQSPLSRLPKANELVIFTPNAVAANEFLEIMVPSATDDVDFTGSGFTTRIQQLIASTSAVKVPLCDRMRLGSTGSGVAPAVRFEEESTPTDLELSSTAVNTPAWGALPWSGGSHSSTDGLRQILIRVEIQIATTGAGSNGGPALPVFGAGVRRYLYRRG